MGRIGFSEYGTPTTEQVPQAVSQEIADCDALLLANHGALTVGTSVMQAYYRMETLEMYARIRLVTIQLGGPAALSEPEIEELFQVRQQRGWGGSPALEVDPRTVELISQVVLQVLQAQGIGSPG
jgi:L-fuculose-phosphate aldolase